MRSAVALPSLGMVASFFIGMGVVLVWGMNVATTGAGVASDFFGGLSTLFTSTVIGWVLLILLIFVVIKLWYIMVPFFVGILIGLFILMYLDSSLYEGITATMVYSIKVMHDKGMKVSLFKRPRPSFPPFLNPRSVIN